MTDHHHFVFVYGTLKKGFRNHHILSQSDATLMGAGQTVEQTFNMIVQNSKSSPDKFTPGVIKCPETKLSIHGELYKVDDAGLKALDILEELGVNYDRIMCDIRCEDGSTRKAWIYLKRDISKAVPEHAQFLRYNTGSKTVSWVHKL